jgi:hypothetical protein
VKGSCERRRKKIVFGSEGWVGFLLELFVHRATFVIGWMVAATEDTFDIFRSVLSVAEMCGVITGAFDASGCKTTIILRVSVALAVCSLGYFTFVFRRFEFDLILL